MSRPDNAKLSDVLLRRDELSLQTVMAWVEVE
jgi:hypothetical protein